MNFLILKYLGGNSSYINITSIDGFDIDKSQGNIIITIHFKDGNNSEMEVTTWELI